MDPLTAWFSHQVAVFGLEMLRIAGLLIAGPLAWTFMPMRARAGLVFMLALVVHQPTEAVEMFSLNVFRFFLSGVSEFSIGVSMGFIARLVFAVGELAADSIAPMMGLGAAQMFDPALGGQGTVLTRVMRYVGLWVGLAIGMHHLILGALFRSFIGIPCGALVNPGSLAPTFIHLTSQVLEAGVKLALPFIAILFIAQVGLAFVARAAPAMQIFSIGFAVTLGVGFLLWIAFAPDLVREFIFLHGWAERNLLLVMETLKKG